MKRSSNRLVLLVGIFLAVVAFVLIAVMFQNGGGTTNTGGPSAAPTTAKIVVATKDISLGAKITADAVGTKDIPIGDKPIDSYADPAQVIGQIARKPVTNGQLITGAIVNGGTAITDISVPAGYVGISVQVDQTTGVGTLIKAGDYVDVVTGFTTFPEVIYLPGVTPKPSASAKPTPTPKTSPSPSASGSAAPGNVVIKSIDAQYDQNSVKTVVEGLQVLGTLLPPVAQDPNASAQPGTTLNGQEQIVILAATVQQAEAIRFAQVAGSIALVLRSSADCLTADGQPSQCPIIPTTGVTLRQMVDQFGVLPPQVIEVVEPAPYPSPKPTGLFPSPIPSPSPSASASANP
ncbi:MAG: Flp pilus assembly protein CpaB [Chloroflexota bacterium]